MIIAGNSHVSMFRQGRILSERSGKEVAIHWVGAVTVGHFLKNHSAALKVRELFGATDDWKILSIGMHDVFTLCRAFRENQYEAALTALTGHYRDIFYGLAQRGRFAWLVSPQQLHGEEIYGLSGKEVLRCTRDLTRAVTGWCDGSGIPVINPLERILDDRGRPRAELLQKDGIHLNSRAVQYYLEEIGKKTGETFRYEENLIPENRIEPRTEPESLALLIAEELGLSWDRTKMPHGSRGAFEKEMISFVTDRLGERSGNTPLERDTDFIGMGGLRSVDLVDIYNRASEIFGVELDFDVNLRDLNTIEKISAFFYGNRPLTINDFIETLATDIHDRIRLSETLIADSRIAKMDEETASRFREIIQIQTGGTHFRYGIIFFWLALLEAEKGNRTLALDLLNRAVEPGLPFPLPTFRTEAYRRLWGGGFIGNPVSPDILKETPNRVDPSLEIRTSRIIEDLYAHAEGLLKDGNRKEAKTAFKMTLEIAPDHVPACHSLGRIFVEEGDLKEAFRFLNQAFALAPWNGTIAGTFADFCRTAGHPEQAERVLSIHRDHAAGGKDSPEETASKALAAELNEKGERMFLEGDVEGARNAFIEALEACPDLASAHNNLGVLSWQEGDAEGAVEHFARAIEIAPRDRDAVMNCGELLRELDRRDAAEDIYSSFLEMNPGDEEIAAALEALKGEPCGNCSPREGDYLVSAVVSTYNAERFIDGRIRNLLDQTLYKRGLLEIIVIDSASPQREREIVEVFRRDYPHIQFIRTPERETVYGAWNRGIGLARGRYIINANTDDRFAEDALERMALELEQDPNIHAVYGDWLVTRTENDSFDSDTEKSLFHYPEFFPPLFFFGQITTHAALIRREVFQEIGLYDDRFKVFGDRDFMFRFSVRGLRAGKIPHIVGLYLQNPTSLERTEIEAGERECASVYERFLEPENFVRLLGQREVPDPVRLAGLYTDIGSLGKDLYNIHGRPVRAFGSAQSMFARALGLDQTNVRALNNLGIISCHSGDHRTAVRLLEKVLAGGPCDLEQVLRANLEAARGGSARVEDYIWLRPDHLEFHILMEPYTAHDEKMTRAEDLFQRGDHDGAERLLREVIGKHPRHAGAHNDLACLLWQTGRHEEAVESMIMAIEIDPEDRDAVWNLGQILLETGRTGEALRTYRSYFSSHPQETDMADAVHTLEGRFREELDLTCRRAEEMAEKGRTGESMDAFLGLLEADPDYAPAHNNLAFLYWQDGDVERAMESVNRAMALAPDDRDVLWNAGQMLSALGQEEEALGLYRRYVDDHPEEEEFRVLLDSGRTDSPV